VTSTRWARLPSEPRRPAAAGGHRRIYSRVLHDLMGRVADDLGLLNLVWSRELLAEAKQALMERKGLAADAAQRWVAISPRTSPTARRTSKTRCCRPSSML
jgi:hypothetical protein